MTEASDAPPRAAPVGLTPTDALLALMALIWGVNLIVVKAALAVFQPLAFNAVRFPLATVALIAVTGLLGYRLPRRQFWLPLALYGFLGNSLYQLGFIEGLGRTRAGNAALLMAANPVLTAVISHWRGHEHLGPRDWLGLMLSGAGVA
ncbi:MAG: DMT family transporter, partial [Gemmatimonadetes bacterium]|nr:DMT family transporter [Gemmatimonadota bacterium]